VAARQERAGKFATLRHSTELPTSATVFSASIRAVSRTNSPDASPPHFAANRFAAGEMRISNLSSGKRLHKGRSFPLKDHRITLS